MLSTNSLIKTVTKKAKRIGRGNGSHKGKNAGKGNKGQTKRGGGVPIGFEGTKSLLRRLPKYRGFKARPTKDTKVISLTILDQNFETGATISIENLKEKQILNKETKVRIILAGSTDKNFKFAAENIYLTKGVKEKFGLEKAAKA